MVPIWIIIFILGVHWFADFVCQTDWQAKNKSTSNKALTLHVGYYSMIWAIATSVLFGPDIIKCFSFVFLTFVAHWLTDYVTSRINKKLYADGKIHWFFVSIGFDQFLHYIQLLLTYQLIC